MFDSKLKKYFITQFDSKLKTFILQLKMFDSELQKHLFYKLKSVWQ